MLIIDRKHIVKSFKGFVRRIAQEQYGSSVLITLFDCVDDTVLISKTIINELFLDKTDSSSFLRNRFGSRVVLYLTSGRNKLIQPSHLLNELKELDIVRKLNTKKEDVVRSNELLEFVSPLLIAAVTENFNELVRDKNGAELILETIRFSKVNFNHLFELLIKLVKVGNQPNVSTTTDEDLGAFHAVKKLRAEHVQKRLESEGLDMNESLMINRNSTSFLKQLIKMKDSEWHAKFSKDLWDVIKTHFEDWMQYCANNSKSSGTCLIFISIYENCEQLQLPMKCSLKKEQIKSLRESIKSENKNVGVDVVSKKRKNGGNGERVNNKKNVIEIMIQYLL
jgi:pumilio family protein 6